MTPAVGVVTVAMGFRPSPGSSAGPDAGPPANRPATRCPDTPAEVSPRRTPADSRSRSLERSTEISDASRGPRGGSSSAPDARRPGPEPEGRPQAPAAYLPPSKRNRWTGMVFVHAEDSRSTSTHPSSSGAAMPSTRQRPTRGRPRPPPCALDPVAGGAIATEGHRLEAVTSPVCIQAALSGRSENVMPIRILPRSGCAHASLLGQPDVEGSVLLATGVLGVDDGECLCRPGELLTAGCRRSAKSSWWSAVSWSSSPQWWWSSARSWSSSPWSW